MITITKSIKPIENGYLEFITTEYEFPELLLEVFRYENNTKYKFYTFKINKTYKHELICQLEGLNEDEKKVYMNLICCSLAKCFLSNRNRGKGNWIFN